MKKYIMNKNVDHNGKFYAKGSEIGDGDPGFKDIVKAGHAQDPFEKEPAEPEQKAEGEQEEQSSQQAKSVNKPKK